MEFGPDDSGTEAAPITYAAATGERVVLSGGRRLSGGKVGEVNGRKAWVVDLPDVKEGRWRFRQLFVNGARRPRTRLPKQGEYRIESLPGYGMAAAGRLCVVAAGGNRSPRRARVRLRRTVRRHRRPHRTHRQLRRRGGRGLRGHRDLAQSDHGSRCGRHDRNLDWNVSGKPVLFGRKRLAEWQALGQDKASLIADPLFMDPAHADFSLRPGSPAAQIGFQAWDLSAAGPRPRRAASDRR